MTSGDLLSSRYNSSCKLQSVREGGRESVCVHVCMNIHQILGCTLHAEGQSILFKPLSSNINTHAKLIKTSLLIF